jgi:hypothetical protein
MHVCGFCGNRTINLEYHANPAFPLVFGHKFTGFGTLFHCLAPLLAFHLPRTAAHCSSWLTRIVRTVGQTAFRASPTLGGAHQ